MENQAGYSDREWGLLVGLPQAVVVAASSAEPDGRGRTRTEGEAGLAAIAEGRDSASALVRQVAAELVVRVGDPGSGEEAPTINFPDREAGIADVLKRAREAATLLAGGADATEAAAYKHWLVTIAEEVAGAAKSGGVLGIGGEWVSAPERRFISDLTVALGD